MVAASSMLLWAFIWLVIGLATTWKWAFDPPKFVADLIVFLALPLIFILISVPKDLQSIGTFLAGYLALVPATIVGDTVGSFVERFTGLLKQLFGAPRSKAEE
jgi:hypothetical protein